ncbi:MAG: YafY family transcriptional regulator [Cyclobacteriaceae bacterium]|nr:YafY family transcriptional regulator [Cyclobacteriaceae bacterium]
MNRLDRLTAILVQLQSKKIVKAEEIADRFEISLRTVYRDVKSLMEAGVPIGSEAGTGYFIVDGYHLPPVMFSQEEASAMLLANKLVEKMSDRSIRAAYESALFKIKSVMNDVDKDHLEVLQSSVMVARAQTPDTAEFPNNFLTNIQRALVQKEVLAIEYQSNQEELTTREIEPIGIQYYSDHWHLIGWCRLRGGYRDFRADRIRSLNNCDKKFDGRNLVSLQEYLHSLMESYKGLEKAVVVINKSVLSQRRYVYGCISEEDLGSSLRLTFLVDRFDLLARWLMSYGSNVEVEHPEKLKEIIIEYVEELQEHYVSSGVSHYK